MLLLLERLFFDGITCSLCFYMIHQGFEPIGRDQLLHSDAQKGLESMHILIVCFSKALSGCASRVPHMPRGFFMTTMLVKCEMAGCFLSCVHSFRA